MLDRLLQSETERVEWKESVRDDEGMYRAVCALANDLSGTNQPGHLLIGVNKQGQPVGVGSDAELDGLQQLVSNRIRAMKLWPTPSFDLTTATIESTHILVVTVFPYPVPPAVSVNNTIWVRQGTTTRRATDADVVRLRERRPENLLPFDQRIVTTASIDDLDRSTLHQMYDAARIGIDDPDTFPSPQQWLTLKQLGKNTSNGWRPNGAAVLLYGLSPESQIPGARIEFARFSGDSIDTAVVTRKSITGSLPNQVDALWAQLLANLASSPETASGVVESFTPLYPEEALKELSRNLVQHRQYEGTNAPGRVEWYSDRIEFSNPGGRFGRSSEGEFGEHSDYRNPGITAGLVELGYVQQLGRGIRRVRLHLEKNGNPPLAVETDGFTRVIVRARA